MKQLVIKGIVIILFLVGGGLLAYPILSNEWNNYVQSQLIDDYESKIDSMETQEYQTQWRAAQDFNSTITENSLGTDVFGVNSDEDSAVPADDFYESRYYSVLNLNGDGIMAYLSIPKINLKLPIMHGTFDEFIQTAVGHMNGTALPIGGPSTHSVIVGHRGLPSADLFTNIDQLEVGDKFYIHVLDETHAYEVDMIYPMVEAEDLDTLSEAMKVEEGKDYITLFTCTPYGVNTHRLLVRGKRVEYLGEDEPPKGTEVVVETVKDYYMIISIIGFILAIIIVIVIRSIAYKKEKNTKYM
ncbi:sortase A [Pseudobutyrivibrio sp. OR37]|uniref:class C sortase n=1 Tax=Pseudobutyrivibrio sp. OR37 TaxID=1798186 RepID=UPI0008EF3CC1|nr:class C sortase [Pseudobutyrivibrio sp. OR37]SFH97816.1 sortase A [Pseudobutyrivibrio sp. OR37]